MKTYLGILTAMILVTFAAMMMVLAIIGTYACFDCVLLKYQESKIAATSNVETAFLGDSSLGFALDAKAFSELSGKKTLNLALTGYNYGFPGADLSDRRSDYIGDGEFCIGAPAPGIGDSSRDAPLLQDK